MDFNFGLRASRDLKSSAPFWKRRGLAKIPLTALGEKNALFLDSRLERTEEFLRLVSCDFCKNFR